MAVDDADPRDPGRPRGALTESDREYLLNGQVGGSKSAENVKRHRIRQRTRQSILDLSLVFQEMSREDASQVFDLHSGDKKQLEDAIIDTLAFLYLGTGYYQNTVQEALERAVEKYAHFSVDTIDVSVDVYEDELVSLERAIDMLENADSIPDKTLNTMRIHVDEIPSEEQLQRIEELDTDLGDGLREGLYPEAGALPEGGYILVPGNSYNPDDHGTELPL